MNKKLNFFSPAKINLFFRVLNKRDDGYHDIASLIQMLSLGDTLSLSLSKDKDHFSTNVSFLAFDETNLIYRALQLFKEKTKQLFFVDIHLEKNIPIQAGLGGGSGNAATILYGLNVLLKTGFSDEMLAQLGATLGADVPSFFSHGRVFCEGVGEKLTPVAKKQESYFIAKPDLLSLSTPLVYKHFSMEDRFVVSSEFVNDLEPAAYRLLPELKKIKLELQNLGFTDVLMTGSGTAFICRGEVLSPKLKEVSFFKTRAIFRDENNWY